MFCRFAACPLSDYCGLILTHAEESPLVNYIEQIYSQITDLIFEEHCTILSYQLENDTVRVFLLNMPAA